MTAGQSRARGFTLVELMVVAVVMSVLAMMALPLAELATTREKERELKRALWEIRDAIDAYKRAVDQGRIARATPSGYPATLQALADSQRDLRGGEALTFLRRVPRDPFAPESLAAEASWGLRCFDSPADSPRAGADVYDVHSLSDRVASNGVPLRRW